MISGMLDDVMIEAWSKIDMKAVNDFSQLNIKFDGCYSHNINYWEQAQLLHYNFILPAKQRSSDRDVNRYWLSDIVGTSGIRSCQNCCSCVQLANLEI